MNLRWLGTAGFEITTAYGTILIDPYFTRLPLTRLFFGRARSTYDPNQKLHAKADGILITHSHVDHLLDTPVIAKQDGCPVYGSTNTCRILSSLEIPASQIREVRIGEPFTAVGAIVTAFHGTHITIPAYGPRILPPRSHPPLRARDYVMDVVQSLHIQCDDFSMLTEPGAPLKIDLPVDILLLSPLHPRRQLRKILLSIKPRMIIASHYDEFWQPLTSGPKAMPMARLGWPPIRRVNLKEFSEIIHTVLPGIPVIFPKVFQPIQPKDYL